MRTRIVMVLCWLVSVPTAQAETRVSEDFEGSAAQIAARWPGQSYCCFPNTGGPFSLVTSPVVNGSQALRYNYTGTQYDNPPQGGGHAEWDYHFGDRDIWVTWSSYMAPGFKTAGQPDGSVAGVATKGLYMYMRSASTGEVHGWVFHYFYGGRQLTLSAQGIKDHKGPNGPGSGPAIPYDTENMWNNVQAYSQPDGQWVGYEAHFKLNTPGQADGLYELYITPRSAGQPTFLATRQANREFVDSNNTGRMPGDSYWFRQKIYRQDGLGWLYLDGLYVTTTRVGFTGAPPPAPGGGGFPPTPPADTSLPNAPTNLTVTELWEDLKALAASVWSWLGPATAEASANDRVTITWPEVEPGTLYELRWQHVGHPDWIPLGRVPSEQGKLVLPLDPPVACAAGQDCWRCADGRAIRDGQTGRWLSETAQGKACSQFAVTPITLPPPPPVPAPVPVPPAPAVITQSGDSITIQCDKSRFTKMKTTGTGTKRVITCLK